MFLEVPGHLLRRRYLRSNGGRTHSVIGPNDPMFIPMLLLLCIMFGLLLPAVWVSHRLRGRLRTNHPSVWKQLGEPGFRNLTIGSSSRAARFVRTGKYRELADPVVNRWARVSRLR